MTRWLQFMGALLLLHPAFEAFADAGVATRAACEPKQDMLPTATCSSLLQSNQTRTSRTSLEVEDKRSLSSHAKANLSQAGTKNLSQNAQILAKRIGLSLLWMVNKRKVESDTEKGGSWIFSIITLLLLVVLGGAAAYLYVQVRDKRRQLAERSHASPSVMMGNTPTDSLMPSAKPVPHKPRPPQRPYTVPSGFGPSTVPSGFGPSSVPSGRGPSAVPSGGGPSTVPSGRGPSTMPSGRAAKDPTPSPSIFPELFLCPELVVPKEAECTLIVPRIDYQGNKMLQVSINDSRGRAVFRMELYPRPATNGSLLVLLSPSGDTTFACCKGIADASRYGHPKKIPALGIYGKNGTQPFGLLVKNGGSFEVTTLAKQTIRFQGQSGSLNAVDEHDKLLALSGPASDEPHGARCRIVRIGPFVDAGLMTICFLGMDVWLNARLERLDWPA